MLLIGQQLSILKVIKSILNICLEKDKEHLEWRYMIKYVVHMR
jgi:hypothetical protein